MSLSKKWFLKEIKKGVTCPGCKEQLTIDSEVKRWVWTGTEWNHTCNSTATYVPKTTFREVLK